MYSLLCQHYGRAGGNEIMKLAFTRIAAFMVDYLVLAIYAVLLSLIVTTCLSNSAIIPGEDSPRTHAHLMGFVTLTLPIWLYFTLQEGSSKRATLGKRLLRLQVNALPPKSMTTLRAGIRNAVKFLPWEIAHAAIWYVPGRPFLDPMPTANLMICFTACLASLSYLASLFFFGGRTPYDRLAGTVVTGVSTPSPSLQSTD
jgi:uncharacterized RDD family membrane protein YckC